MYLKYMKMLLAALLVSALIPTYSQVASSATAGGLPLTVGVGYSNYATDWNGRLSGPTLWADWNFYHGPPLLRGFGIEIEARDLNYDRTGSDPKLRMDTAGGGAIYTWRHYRNFHPYGKFLVEYGSIDFNINSPGYTHDSRTVYAPGGGLDYRVFQNIWVRGDYEYQFWPSFFHHHALNPNGFTIGASYDFRRIGRH
jgi:opacity protein-like surface antigen